MHIVSDNQVARIDQGQIDPPDDWASRAVYRGAAGARNWLAVVGEPGYPLNNPEHLGLLQMRTAALAGARIGTFLSLGPGDGSADLQLIKSIAKDTGGRNPAEQIIYVPVDLSRSLLEHASCALQPAARVPVSVQSDFEVRQPFIMQAISEFRSSPIILSLLGGTLGNLDRGVRAFFSGWRAFLAADDAILLDIPLAGPAWTISDEPRLNLESYSTPFRRFVATALPVGEYVDCSKAANTDASHIFAQRVAFDYAHDVDTQAETVRLSDRVSGRTLLTFRRFRWKAILNWLEQEGFAVEYAQNSIRNGAEKFGMGVVRLGLRKPPAS